MRTFRAGVPLSLILVGLLSAACVSTAPAAPTASTAAVRTAGPTVVTATSKPAPPRGRRTTQPQTAAPTDAPTDPATDEPSDAPTESAGPAPTQDPWSLNAGLQRDSMNMRFTIQCPAGGTPRTVWGTTFYTDDSSICTAAVHRGAITLESGGPVTYEIAPAQDSYEGSTQNGITTVDYGPWGGTFVIVIE